MSTELEVSSNPLNLGLGPSETPFEAAATMFGLYAPKFEAHIKTLSTGELRRLVNALVQYPINEKEFVNDSQKLKTAFSLGQVLLEAKWVMLMQSMMEVEQQNLQKNESTEEAIETEMKEVQNG
jgi:hypothetical protein